METYNEKNRIIQTFKMNYSKYMSKPKSLVLYGLGNETKFILEEFPESAFLGVLDGFMNEGEFCKMQILSLAEIRNRDVTIIVLARKASEKIIFKRIQGFCKSQNIGIFNLEGYNLFDTYSLKYMETDVEERFFYEEVLEKLEKYQNISFDIFDTLFIRSMLIPEQIFKLIEEVNKLPFFFTKERIQTEKELSIESVPNIKEIYLEIQKKNNLSNAMRDELMQAEIQYEIETIKTRRNVKRLFDQMVKNGKNVYLISDMYFTKDIMELILKKKGIWGYKELFISCEYRVDKRHGLFQEYLDIVSDGDNIHLGDSYEGDVVAPREYGIDSIHIIGWDDLNERLELKNGLVAQQEEKKNVMDGMVLSELFNNPFFTKEGKICFDNSYYFGYTLLGPIVVELANWLMKKAEEEKIEEILFVSRDGFLVKKIFDLLCDTKEYSIRSEYLTISRTLGMNAFIKTDEDIRYVAAKPFAGKLSEFFVKRFGLNEKKLSEYLGTNLLNENMEAREEYALEIRDLIIENSSALRMKYKNYLNNLELDEYMNIAIFDFVSTGTCQMSLEKILNRKIMGLYFERVSDAEKSNLNIEDYIRTLGTKVRCNCYFLFEILMKEPVSSVQTMNERNEFEYAEDRLSKKQKDVISLIQKGAFEFAKEYVGLIKNIHEEDNSSIVKRILKMLEEDRIELPEDMKLLSENFDEFTNRQIIL